MSEWISVEERLPPIGTHVLCVSFGKRVNVGHTTISRNNRGEKTAAYCWHGAGGFAMSARDVTHWMPLPAPPEPQP